jgi:DtxR family Mn-dependent transcriptional regulator
MPRKSSDSEALSEAAPLIFSLYRMAEDGEAIDSLTVQNYMQEKGLDSDAPATRQVRLLKEAGFITAKGRNISLTRKGETNAERIVRKYRLSEVLALNVFGLDVGEVDEHARLIAGVMTERLEERTISILDNPETSPFGYPIPGLFSANEKDYSRLSDAEEGRSFVVAKVPVDNGPLLSRLVEIGAMPGQRLTVHSSDPIAGIVHFDIEGENHILAVSVANSVWVTEAPDVPNVPEYIPVEDAAESRFGSRDNPDTLASANGADFEALGDSPAFTEESGRP